VIPRKLVEHNEDAGVKVLLPAQPETTDHEQKK
jgi:hypothetical protein